jgi:hypothetical protein
MRPSTGLKTLCNTAIPLLGVHFENRELRRRSASSLEELEDTESRYTKWYGISVAKLDELLIAERERARRLEGKAVNISATLALAVTIGSSFAKALTDSVPLPHMKMLMQCGLLISMTYFILGAAYGFSGISTKPHSGYGPDWEAQLIDDHAMDKGPRVEALVNYELANLIRNNDISGALECIRNGTIFLFAVIFLRFAEPFAPLAAHMNHIMMEFIFRRSRRLCCPFV